MAGLAHLVLAAGGGRRFGGPKALAAVGDELAVERAVRLGRDAGCDLVAVVLGAGADEVRERAELAGVQVVVAERWSDGMGFSLAAGLEALPATDADAVAVTLVDQPLLGPESLRRVERAWRDGAVAAVAHYDGVPGHPVLLDRSVWPEVLASVDGDSGARGWLRANADRVVGVDCDGTGRPDDADTADDLARLVPPAHDRR
jgi:CTP:molybdopterin cytidylyltransferase MocA